MNPRMTPTVLTAWRRRPEGRSVSWTPMGPMRCRWDETRETRASASGDAATWAAELLLPRRTDEAPLLKGDRVALGASSAEEPPHDALEVVECHPVHRGGPRPHHWEATAR